MKRQDFSIHHSDIPTHTTTTEEEKTHGEHLELPEESDQEGQSDNDAPAEGSNDSDDSNESNSRGLNEKLDTENEDHLAGSGRFQEGDIITLVRVRFPGNAKSFPFILGDRNFIYGQQVIAMSDRGLDVGHINSFPYERPFLKSMLPLRSIARVATQEDIEQKKIHSRQEIMQKIFVSILSIGIN